MRAVNLLPGEQRVERESILGSTAFMGVLGAGLIAVMCIAIGVTVMQSQGKVSKKQETLEHVQQQVAEIRAKRAAAQAEVSTDSPAQARIQAFQTASSSRVSWETLLSDLSRVLPSGAWFSNLDAQSGIYDPTGAVEPAATEAPPTAFTVTGMALSQNTVAEVMNRLTLVPMLSKVTLQQSSQTSIGDATAFQFTISASLRTPGVTG